MEQPYDPQNRRLYPSRNKRRFWEMINKTLEVMLVSSKKPPQKKAAESLYMCVLLVSIFQILKDDDRHRYRCHCHYGFLLVVCTSGVKFQQQKGTCAGHTDIKDGAYYLNCSQITICERNWTALPSKACSPRRECCQNKQETQASISETNILTLSGECKPETSP